jgi:hypothetical protein
MVKRAGEAAYKTIPIDEAIAYARRLAAPAAERIAYLLEDYRDGFAHEEGEEFRTVQLYEGDVAVEGDFLVKGVPVLIDGNLTAKGHLTDNIETFYSLLMVTGTVRCRDVWTLCCIYVAGDVELENVFYGASLDDHWTEIEGSLRARAVIENGHTIRVGRALDAPCRFGSKIEVMGEALPPSTDLHVFVSDVIMQPDDECIDEERLYRRLLERKEVLRTREPGES